MMAPELAKTAKEVFGVHMQVIYGQTEACPIITTGWADDSLKDATETIGQPLLHVEVSIRDGGGILRGEYDAIIA